MDVSPEPPPTGGSGATDPGVRLRLDVAYDGAGFRGFAENAGVRTVAGELRGALEAVLGQPVKLSCAGRTDAGVHAWGQVVTADVDAPPVDALGVRRSVNAMLGPEVVVWDVRRVPADFDARFSARWRRYRYLVWNAEVPHPFLDRTSWWIPEALDVPAMSAACEHLSGEHDFSSFCRRPDPAASLVRRVLDAHWDDSGPDGALCFEITASAFCHQMVRSIVGTLVAVGRGRLAPAGVGAILAARDRSGTPNLAPPKGLTLWEVGYDDPPGSALAG